MDAPPPAHSPIDLTIIIPVYNALPYFHKCIESITSQDLGQYVLEVILVDDGSTDGSGEYCDEAASQWNYIRAIHIENSGTPARPRNIGIEEASGNYIFFCDADDYFEENALAPMLDHAYEDKCDVGLFKMVGEGGRGTALVFNDNKIWKHHTVSGYKGGNPFFLRTVSPLKLFELSFLKKLNIQFPENVLPEDFPFMLECYFNASNICIYNDQVYYHLVKRVDGANLSLGNVSSFTKLEPHLASIEKCFSIASRYTSPNNCPEVYRKIIVGPLPTTLARLKALSPEQRYAVMAKIREYFYPCNGSEPLRQILGLRNIVLLDALFLCDDENFLEIYSDWPNGFDISFFKSPDRSLNYVVRADKDGEIILQAPLPLNLEQDDQPIQTPGLLKNRITHFETTNETIVMAGHVKLLRCCDHGGFDVKLRIHFFDDKYDRWFENVGVQNVTSENVYASVYQIEFDWNISYSFADLVPVDDLETSRIYFFLDIGFDTGEIVSNRFGNNRTEGAFQNFISQAVWCNGYLFAPYETKYKNFSFYAYSNTDPIKATRIEFKERNNEWYLSVQGKTTFDNFPSTQIELALLDKESNDILCLPMKKGDELKDRKFKGSFKLDELDDKLKKGVYSLEIRVAIANKTLRSQNIEIAYNKESVITHLQTTNEAIEMAGHVQLLHRCDQGEFTAKLRIHFYDGDYDRWLDTELQNVTSENVYASVYQIEFDWSSRCLFKDLVPSDSIDPTRIYLFLDIEFNGGEVISERLGHNRVEGIYSNFISQATWCNDCLLTPYETKYKNFSFYAYSNVQLIKTISLGFLRQDDQWHLAVLGTLNFDNYASTKIELVVLDTNDKENLNLSLEKGEGIKDRSFKGSVSLGDLDKKLRKGIYRFELRVAVANKILRCRDFEIGREAKGSVGQNGKQDILYATSENVLYLATQQRIPLKQKIARRSKQ